MWRRGNFSDDRVLALLKQAGTGLSIKELCQKLDLSSMAVRRQLIFLEGNDLLFSEREQLKVGRPAHRYYLTEKGHEEFERDYTNLALDLLDNLCSIDGKEKIDQVFANHNRVKVETYRHRVLGKTLEARVHEVSQFLAEDGYRASWEKIGPKKFLIKEMNCPVAQVARRFPHPCIYEEEFLSELLQAKVTRKHHILQKDHFFFLSGF